MNKVKWIRLTLIIGVGLSLSAILALVAQATPEMVDSNLAPRETKHYALGSTQLTACDTYYLRRTEINVGAGADGGVRKIANTTLPPAGAHAVASQQLNLPAYREIVRFYTDPILAANLNISEAITGRIWVQTDYLNTSFRLELFDYNPANGSKTALGNYTFGLISTGENEVEFSLTPSLATIPAGHRLMFVLSGRTDVLAVANVHFFYDSPSRLSRFTVCRPAPQLSITKSGPAFVTSGQAFTYTLNVANSGTLSATNLVISDTIPAGANYVTGGTKLGNVVRWTTAALAPDSSLQFTFTVTATATVTNSVYRVVADNNVSATGQAAVVTLVTANPPRRVYLPLVFRGVETTLLIVKSEKTGGINPVKILDLNNNQLLSCSIGNNVTQTCGTFPAIGTYKIVAHTANCGVLQGTFNDAAPGATVTRRIFCN